MNTGPLGCGRKTPGLVAPTRRKSCPSAVAPMYQKAALASVSSLLSASPVRNTEYRLTCANGLSLTLISVPIFPAPGYHRSRKILMTSLDILKVHHYSEAERRSAREPRTSKLASRGSALPERAVTIGVG